MSHPSKAEKTWWQEFLPHRIEDFREWLGPHSSPSRAFVRSLVNALSSDNVTVLDCGCGLCIDRDGYIADGYSQVSYTGLDSCGHLVELAKQRYIDAVCAELTAIPFGDGSFDAVCIREVLEHLATIEEVHAAISEVMRVARRRVFVTFFLPPESERRMEYHEAEIVHHNQWSLDDITAPLAIPRIREFCWHDASDGRRVLEIEVGATRAVG